jgi:transcriptional regulator with XRE-family HTH domain
MKVYENRRANLARLILIRFGGQKKALSDALGSLQSQVSQWLGGNRNISEKSARRIEELAGVSPGWLDAEPSGTVEVREPSSAVVTPLPRPSLRSALEVLCTALSVLREPERRESVGTLLRACAVGGGDTSYIDAIIATMRKNQPPQAVADKAQ